MKYNGLLCLVLDSSFIPRSIVPVERGFIVSFKGNASIIEEYDEPFRTVDSSSYYPKPSVIRLNRYVNLEYRNVPLSRYNIFKRDEYECVYCGCDNLKSLTIDHVVPRSKGGQHKWNNVVTACEECNHEKSNLSLEEWGRTSPNPKRPHYLMMMRKYRKNLPKSWDKYLFV